MEIDIRKQNYDVILHSQTRLLNSVFDKVKYEAKKKRMIHRDSKRVQKAIVQNEIERQREVQQLPPPTVVSPTTLSSVTSPSQSNAPLQPRGFGYMPTFVPDTQMTGQTTVHNTVMQTQTVPGGETPAPADHNVN